jgi:hypothetical protein
MPCRWSDNRNGWAIFTTTQGYIGHVDEKGNWYLGDVGLTFIVDLNTIHDWYLKHNKKFELPEEWPEGDEFPHPVKNVDAQ